MIYENNAELRDLLRRGVCGQAVPNLRDALLNAKSFVLADVDFDTAVNEVKAQHTSHSEQEAHARAAYRLLTKTKSPDAPAIPRHSIFSKCFWSRQRVWACLRVVWAILVLFFLLLIAARPLRGQERPEEGSLSPTISSLRMTTYRTRLGRAYPSPASDAPNGIIIQVSNQGTVLATRPAGILKFDCTTGMSCSFSGITFTLTSTGTGGGSPALSAILAATAANTINSGDFAQVWNWSLTTASKSAFTFGENVASTATGTPLLLNINTLAASTAFPLQVTARGTANGVRVDAATGSLSAIGTANINATQYKGGTASGTGSCTNQAVTALNDAAAPACSSLSGSFFANQNANLIFSGPSSGGAAAPTFRATVKADLPSTTVYTDQANTYTAGQKQTFQNSAATAGMNLATSADPSTLSQGDHWLNGEDVKWRGASTTHTAARSDGGGANNTVAKFTGANTIANACTTDDGATVDAGGGACTIFKVPRAGAAAPTAQGAQEYNTTQDATMAGGRGAIKGAFPRVLASCWSTTAGSGCFGTGASTATADCLSNAALANCTNIGTTETAYATNFQIPANYLLANKTLRLSFFVEEVNGVAGTTEQIQLRVQKSGPANVYLYTPTAHAGAAGAVIRGNAVAFLVQGTAAGAAVSVVTACQTCNNDSLTPFDYNTISAIQTIDTTAVQTFQLTSKFSATTATAAWAVRGMLVEELN